jgi:hypothetical protein
MTTEGLSTGQVEELKLEELEARAARLLHLWVEHTLGELEETGTANLQQASQQAQQARHVFDVLDQVYSATDRVRSILR